LLLSYCRHLLIPTPLSPFYDSSYVDAANRSFWQPLIILAAIAGVAYFCAKRLRNGGLIAFCTCAMAISMIPVLDLNIFQFREIMHDRFLYLPSVFFAILIGHFSLSLAGETDATSGAPAKATMNPIYAALGAALVVLNVAALLVQSPVWKNDLTLFSYAVRIAPHNPRPAFSLAMDQLERGNLPEAERLLQHTVRLVAAPKALFLLGQTRLRMGQADTAEAPLRQAIAAAPDRPGQHFALGECLRRLGRTEEASAEFRAETAIGPDFREAALQRLSELRAGKM
jgi:protein O-mannosyl-transferase